jgi:predicted enzyme related to lactoylglutathione lyase
MVFKGPSLTMRTEEAMATTRKATKKTNSAEKPQSTRATNAPDVPTLFRINVEVGDLNQAAEFYGKLFGLEGRRQAGSRCYFDCGPVTLQVVDVSSMGIPHPAAKALYFLVKDLDKVFKRAKALGCLSRDDVHGVSGGAISVRPWGERSFYAEDKWENPLCFVEAGTVYPG